MAERVTASEYARMRGKAIGTVQKAIATGRVKRGPDGLVAVADADAYWQSCRTGGECPPALAAARVRKLTAEAELAELRAVRHRAELVSVDAAAELWASLVGDLRARLLALPADLAPVLEGLPPAEARKVLGEALRAVLTTAAPGGLVA